MGASWVSLLVAPSSSFSSSGRSHLESARVYEGILFASCRVRCIQHAIVFLDRTDTVPSREDPRREVDVHGNKLLGRSPHAETEEGKGKSFRVLLGAYA